MRQFSIMTLGLMLCILVVCLNVNADSLLVEPSDPLGTRKYESENANRTLTLPVALVMREADTVFSITGKNLFGSTVSRGAFMGGEIVAREFRRAIAANFHIVDGDEIPLAKIVVRVNGISVKILSKGNIAEAALQIRVDVMRNGDSVSAYSQTFSVSAQKKWESNKEVPSAFYEAVDMLVRKFLSDWDSSGAVATVLKWNDSANQGVVPPELKTIKWEKKGDVWLGWCEIQCNGYEGFKAKAWANAQIAVACRTKLGNVNPERVKIIYDKENFDENARKWIFAFRTLILKWNDSAPQGVTPPELKAIEWEKKGDVWQGRCEVQCNDYEGFQAKAWANAKIAVACQTKLGIIDPERVRILYDMENFDENAQWTFVFRAFGRSPMILSFDKFDNHGQVVGDIDLMNVKNNNKMDIEKAVEKLKNFVLSQMGSFAGAVSLDAQKGKALVRFDDFKMDATNNLVTINFRLVGH